MVMNFDSEEPRISDTEYDLSGNLHLLLHVGADILHLLFLNDLFIFFHVHQMVRLDKATYLSLLLKIMLFERFSISLYESDVLLYF